MKQEYSSHQRKIIHRYYDQQDTIMLAKLQDMVGELYLADSDKKRERLWKRVRKALEHLKMGSAVIEHLVSSGDPKLLAGHIQDLLRKK